MGLEGFIKSTNFSDGQKCHDHVTFSGLDPVTGQDTYFLSQPLFPTITFNFQVTGATTTITSTNFSKNN